MVSTKKRTSRLARATVEKGGDAVMMKIEAMKQERFDNWYAIITDPAPAPVIEDPVVVEEVVEEPEEFLIINGVKYIKSKE